MKTYYLYYLIDPNTNEVRYIGITYRPTKRFNEHLLKAKNFKTHKDKWIMKLLDNNQKPIFKIVFESINKNEILEYEITHIANHKNLTNSTSGGDYFTFTPEVISKLKDINKGENNPCYKRVWSDKERQNLSTIHKGVKKNVNWRKNIGMSMKNRKEVTIDGITYYSLEEAMRVLKISSRKVHKYIKK
jgi:hypothetical protein